MKKLLTFFFAFATIITVISCHYGNGHRISLSVSESEHSYSMDADFNNSRSRDVDEYMDRRIGAASNMSFVNSRVNALLTLDDHTTFHMRKYPGHVEIDLDKDKNSDEAYHRIKSMCEGIKNVITK